MYERWHTCCNDRMSRDGMGAAPATTEPVYVTPRRFTGALLSVVVSCAIIGWLLLTMGVEPFLAALRSLSPLSAGAALIAGLAATVIQAQRWRIVSRGFGMNLGLTEAVAQCWQASFLNSVLPGGLAGDALRAVEQRGGVGGTWRGSVGSVVGERIVATVITLAAAAVVLLPRELWLGAAVTAVTLVVAVFAWFAIRGISWASRVRVVALSCAGWVVFAGLFAVAVFAGERSGPPATSPAEVTIAAGDIVGLAALTLAGMSIPVSLGGWGPREGAAAFGFVLFGYSAAQGVAVAVSYGILALVSASPGAIIMLVRAFMSDRKTPSKSTG